MCVNSSRCIPSKWRCDGDGDCQDGSDEQDCGNSTHTVCSAREFQCSNFDCIHKSWHCDGDADCVDGSDEVDCPTHQCSDVQFQCSSGQCIMGSLVCNGNNDCEDESDEKDCTHPKIGCDLMTEFDCHKDGLNCIDLTKVCNSRDDCGQGEDEAQHLCTNQSTYDPCQSGQHGCTQLCSYNVNGVFCSCKSGFKLDENNKTCNGKYALNTFVSNCPLNFLVKAYVKPPMYTYSSK